MFFDSPGPYLIAPGGQVYSVIEKTGLGHRQALLGERVGHIEKVTAAFPGRLTEFVVGRCNGFLRKTAYLHGHKGVQGDAAVRAEFRQSRQHAAQYDRKVRAAREQVIGTCHNEDIPRFLPGVNYCVNFADQSGGKLFRMFSGSAAINNRDIREKACPVPPLDE